VRLLFDTTVLEKSKNLREMFKKHKLVKVIITIYFQVYKIIRYTEDRKVDISLKWDFWTLEEKFCLSMHYKVQTTEIK